MRLGISILIFASLLIAGCASGDKETEVGEVKTNEAAAKAQAEGKMDMKGPSRPSLD